MQTLTADPAWRVIELLSDVHLAPEAPGTLERWAGHLLASDADALIILGDLFEVWVGDDAREAGFESRCVEALSAAAKRRPVYFVHGNRDFLIGSEMLAACGMQGLDDPTLLVAFGSRFLLTHGDALCLADVEYQRFRAEVRTPGWQRDFLDRPLAQRRAIARGMRDASTAAQRGRDTYADIDRDLALRWLHDAGATTLIHGHTHRPGDEALAPGLVRHVLSDWHFDTTPPRGDVLRLSAAGVQRVVPSAPPS